MIAVAPVADELKTLTIFHVCANYRLFDKGTHKYVFRTAVHAASENISGALYVLAMKPDLKTIAGDSPARQKRDVFLYMISGAKVRAPAAAMALIERL